MTDWVPTGGGRRPVGNPAGAASVAVDGLDVPHPQGGPACSAGSRERDEPLAATASLGRRWLLVEVAGAWGWSAFSQSPALDPALGRAIVKRAEAEGLRVLAIRRPGRSRGAPRWRWALVDTTLAEVVWGEAASADDLLDVPLDGSTGEPSDEPLFVVCAHGRHDECCAVRGRSVAADLAAAHPEVTWECSHLGGDRFAATMILFPHGLNYGRVDDLDPVGIATAYLEGRIEERGFRGRVAFSHAEQAALAAVARASRDDRVDAWRPVAVRALPAAAAASATLRVELAGPTGWASVDLAEETSDPLFTMCRATVPVAIRRYRVVSVDIGQTESR